MDADRAAEELKVIRQLMERPVRYSTQSGLSGIIAGLAALAGLAADWEISRAFSGEPGLATQLNLAVWACVFAAALAGALWCTRLRERKRGMPFWSNVKRRIAMTILPPFVAGVGLTGVIVARWYAGDGPNAWGLIPAVWMLFYGVALWQVGEFGVRELRFMGAAFILAGLVSAALLQMHPYMTVGVTFGGFHIAYGAVVWMRYGG